MKVANSSICLRWSTSSLMAWASGRCVTLATELSGTRRTSMSAVSTRTLLPKTACTVSRATPAVGDVLHGRAGVPALEEELRRGVEDARSSAGRLLVAHSRGVLALSLDVEHYFILQSSIHPTVCRTI